MSNEFGQYLKALRKEKQISLRKLSGFLGVSAAYLSDVERGRRLPLKADKLSTVVKALGLNNGEKYKLMDLAVQEHKGIPADIAEYLNNNPMAKEAIRTVAGKNLDSSVWQAFIDSMNEEVKKNAG